MSRLEGGYLDIMTTIVAVGHMHGIVIAADSQVNMKQMSTGMVLERSIGHQKIFPLPDLPMVIVDTGMEMTDIGSLETRLNAIRRSIMLSLKNGRDINDLSTEEIKKIFTYHTISAYQIFSSRLPIAYHRRFHSAIFFSDTERKNGFALIMFPGYTTIARNELSSLIMGHPYDDPRMLKLDRKHRKHFKRRKSGEAINVAKTLVAKGIEIDEDSGGNIQMVELTPKGWQWLAKP